MGQHSPSAAAAEGCRRMCALALSLACSLSLTDCLQLFRSSWNPFAQVAVVVVVVVVWCVLAFHGRQPRNAKSALLLCMCVCVCVRVWLAIVFKEVPEPCAKCQVQMPKFFK